MKIGFDHCYQKTLSADGYFRLRDRGFTTEERTVEHPGGQFSRFLRFNKPENSTGGLNFHYLEFVEVPDVQVLKKTFDSEVSEKRVLQPGFSLSCDQNLKELFVRTQTDLPQTGPQFQHKNYAWKDDDHSDLPGWNFLKFEEPLIDEITVWCTEYEPHPDRKTSGPLELSHANTVDHLRGFAWNLPRSRLAQFQTLSGAKSIAGGLQLRDGLAIYCRDSDDVMPALLWDEPKDSPFAAVILTCNDWSTFLREAKPDVEFDWNGRKAGLIRTSPLQWDILILSNEKSK